MKLSCVEEERRECGEEWKYLYCRCEEGRLPASPLLVIRWNVSPLLLSSVVLTSEAGAECAFMQGKLSCRTCDSMEGCGFLSAVLVRPVISRTRLTDTAADSSQMNDRYQRINELGNEGILYLFFIQKRSWG